MWNEQVKDLCVCGKGSTGSWKAFMNEISAWGNKIEGILLSMVKNYFFDEIPWGG